MRGGGRAVRRGTDAARRIDDIVDGTQGRPQGVYAQILVEVDRVVQRDWLQALQICGELVEFGEAPAALLFHADLDLADPATLEFDPLRDDFLLPVGGKWSA